MRVPNLKELQTIDPAAVFTVKEAGRLLGLSSNAIITRIKRGEILAGRSGARYFVPGSEIQKQIVMPGELNQKSDQSVSPDNL